MLLSSVIFLHLSRFVLVLGSMSVLLDTVVRFMSSVECVFCFSVLRVMWFKCVMHLELRR